MFRHALLLVWLGLTGCATLPPDALSGRLSLQVDAHADRPAQSIVATFELQGTGERGELRLSTPLGTTLATTGWGPGEARLTTPQGETRFADLDELSQATFGEVLPLRALPDWLRGRPWLAAPQASGAALPGPGFLQLGWRIDLQHFADGVLLATRTGPPAARLRAKLDLLP